MSHDLSLGWRSVEQDPLAPRLAEEPIPAELAREGEGINRKFLIAGVAVILLVAGLMVNGLLTASAYFMTVQEAKDFYAQALAAPDPENALAAKRIRVNGLVVADSEDWRPEEVTLYFAIADEENPGQTMQIVFYGPRPDNFQRAASAIVEGQFLPDGTFQADTLLLKCPSRYEEEPEEIFVKATR